MSRRLIDRIGLVLWIAGILACATGLVTASTPPIRVLHVSVKMADEVEHVLQIAGASALFTVEQISLADFNAGQPGDLDGFDVVVFGISDGYEGSVDPEIPFEPAELPRLEAYVARGGGIVWTHDTLDCGADLGEPVEEPAGVDHTNSREIGGSSLRFVEQDHAILHAPFKISPLTPGEFGVRETHTAGGVVTSAIVIASFHDERRFSYNFYLTVNEYGAGRVVVNEMGRSFWEAETYHTTWPNIYEAQLFANCLYWAARGSDR